jgi:uncharacterized membrane protein YedE/YeeE
MLRIRPTALGFGAVFGMLIAWAGVADPDMIRRMLLLQQARVYLIMASAVAVGFVGLRIVRRWPGRSLVTGETISWTMTRPDRRHVLGGSLFGLGWAVSDSCPGPIAVQLGAGVVWSLATVAGVGLGVLVYQRRHDTSTAAVRERGLGALPAGE